MANELNQWLNEELKTINNNKPKTTDYPPAVKFEEGVITEVTIDFTQSFPSWTDPKDSKVKKIVPCLHKGVKASWWINCANPIYKQLLEAGVAGQKVFKILRTGQLKATRYTLIRE